MPEGPIKIAYFIDRVIFGGTELQLVEQINRLEGNGARQILFCLYESSEHRKLDIPCRVEILNIRRLRNFYNVDKIKKVVKTLRHEKIEFVQTYFFDSTLLGVLCGKLGGVNKIITCRRDMGFWYTKSLLFWLRIANRFTDRILVNSDAVKMNVHKLENVSLSSIDVIRNGIDTKKYQFTVTTQNDAKRKLGVKNSDLCVGIIANMTREVKRLDLFIEAARIMVSRGIAATFYILGDGHLRSDLEHLVKKYRLENCVSFLGKAYNKRTLLAVLDIGVITSDSEGLSNSLLEYMASNIVPVASDVGGNRELIQQGINGYLFKAGDAIDLANTLEAISENKEGRSKIEAGAREYVFQYDWSIRRKEILQYYRSLLSDRGAA